MFDAFLIAALAVSTVLGTALLRLRRAERRSASLQSRLEALAGEGSATDKLVVSLRRPRQQRGAIPPALSARLDLALAAAGDCVGRRHLAASGMAAIVVVGSVAAIAGFRLDLTIALAGAAAAGAPALLLRILQRRYQRRFLDGFPDALDLIVRAVRAGIPAPEALDIVTRESKPPVGTEFRRLLVPVLKTGGPAEHEAFDLLDRHVRAVARAWGLDPDGLDR